MADASTLTLEPVARENARRAARNVRKVLVGLISKVSLEGEVPAVLVDTEAEVRVKEALSGKARPEGSARDQLDRLVAEFDGEVEPGAEGRLLYRFPAYRRQVEAAHAARASEMEARGRSRGAA